MSSSTFQSTLSSGMKSASFARTSTQKSAVPSASVQFKQFGARSATFSGSKVQRQVASLQVQRVKASRMVTQAARFESEQTYVMIKPDGVQRGLVGEIIGRFEKKGFQLKGLKMFQCPKELAEKHYGDLSERPFFPDLVDYIISAPVVCMLWEGPGAVKSARKLIGATNPLESEPGTIRGDLAIEVGRNVVHGSDSVENGQIERDLWFKEAEIIDWEQSALGPWLREM